MQGNRVDDIMRDHSRDLLSDSLAIKICVSFSGYKLWLGEGKTVISIFKNDLGCGPNKSIVMNIYILPSSYKKIWQIFF